MSLILLGAVLATAGLSRASTPFIASGEIRPGMTGYGLTVFQGTRVTRFPVTVLGVVRGYLAGADLILIRVDGGYPVEHGTGIIAGMSGSPVYIGGRLAGAISYGYIFSKEPIGGVTPIQDMLREIAPPAGERPAGLPWGSVGRLERPVEASGQSYRQVRLAPLPEKGEPGTLVLTPLSPLIQTGGLGARALEVLKERLAPLPVRAVAGFSGPPVRASVPPLVPGAALGVQLMEGDLTASATGTLTWRDGDRLVAFGHPMGEYGDVDFPLVACYVHAIVPSYQFSYKLASPLAIVGRITRDRLWAVGGRLHQPSVMLPLRLQVGEKTYRVKVAQHRWMTAALVESCLTQAIGAAVPALSEGSARLRYRLEPAGHPPIELTDIVSGPQVDSQAAARLGELVAELMDNPFQPLKLARLEVQVETLAGQRSATVEKIYTDRSQYQPGDVVRLGVVLRPYGQAPQVRECELPLPPDLPRGTVKIGVAGGSDLELLNKTLSLSSSSPRDLDSLLRQLTSRERGQELAIRAVFPGEGLRVRQERFPQLPASLAQVLADSPHSELEKDKEVYSARLDTPWALQGQASVQVEIVDRLAGGNPTAGSLAPETTPSEVVEVAPGSRRWEVRGAAQWRRGEFMATGLSPQGELTLVPRTRTLLSTSDPLVWSLARSPEGRLFAGLGSAGEIVEVAAGSARPFARTGEAAILCLAAPGDRVWAGSGARGRVFVFDGRGTLLRRLELPVSYVWALLPDGQGGCYAATGLPGRLYRVGLEGAPELLWDSGEQHLRALCPDGAGLLVGSANRGILYRWEKGTASLLLQTGYPSVDALARFGDFTVVASGAVLHILDAELRPVRRVPLPGGPALALAATAEGVWTAAGSSLYLVNGRAEVLEVPGPPGRPYLALAGGSEVAAARAFGAEVLALGPPAAEGSYLSEVLDAGSPSFWGEMRWLALAGPGQVSLQTRSGASRQPDSTWSGWSLAASGTGGQPVTSPPARYLQVKVNLRRGPEETPRLQGFSVFLGSPPVTPEIRLLEPRGGERWSGLRRIRWKLERGDIATTSFDVEISGDGGRTWLSLEQGRPAGPPEESVALATRRFADGVYLVRVVAYDRTAPAEASRRFEQTSGPLVLANTPPTVSLRGGSGDRVEGSAASPQVAIVDVVYRLNRGPWLPARAADGLFDSRHEDFVVLLPPGARGTLEVRARDEAGNETISSQGLAGGGSK